MNPEQKVRNFHNIFTQLKKEYKWTQKTVLMMVASTYIMKSKPFDMETLKQTARMIKKEAGLFSFMDSRLTLTAASALDVHFSHPVNQVERLFTVYNELIQSFKRGNFTYLTAIILLTNDENISRQDIISKAETIHGHMKKAHPFLTGTSDYPLATLLAYKDSNDVDRRMEYFYDALKKHTFQKGKDLQFLSHVLSLAESNNDDGLIHRIIRIHDEFKQTGFKQKSMYYPLMGMLGLLPTEQVDMSIIKHIHEQLKSINDFKWQKDLHVMLAVSFFVTEKLADSHIAEMSVFTAVETIIQAQQAVMMAAAATGGAAAAASSSGGN